METKFLALLLLPLLLLPHLATPLSAAPLTQDDHNDADTKYREAMDIRLSENPTSRAIKRSVALLFSAAAIINIRTEPLDKNTTTHGKAHTYKGVNISYKPDSIPHTGALWELALAFRDVKSDHSSSSASSSSAWAGVTFNPAVSHRLLYEAAQFGDPMAQSLIGMYEALGIVFLSPSHPSGALFKVTPPNTPSALTRLYFAARDGDPSAQTVMGNRHLYGIGVPESCSAAVAYYAPAAEAAIELSKRRDALPQIKNTRLSRRTVGFRPKTSAEQEVLHYQWFADFGNIDAARMVAHVLSHGAVRDADQAVRYWEVAADAGDAGAMAHLGHAHANGIGVDRNSTKAAEWFQKAANKGHPGGLLGLGYMHLSGDEGVGGKIDHAKAFRYMRQTIEGETRMSWTGQADAFFYLGMMYLKGWGTRADIKDATNFFTLSSTSGNMLAAYNLAMLHLGGQTKHNNACQEAVKLLKKVAERQFFTLSHANEAFTQGHYDSSLLDYLISAELGAEVGQSNAAWMLTEGYGSVYDSALDTSNGSVATAASSSQISTLALVLYQRAAEQGSTAALIRLGDAHWYGRGAPKDWKKAVSAYNEAGKKNSARGLFNLGIAHTWGAGAVQDAHLAKRYFDRAVVAEPDAALAVQLSLFLLRTQAVWEWVEPKLPTKLQPLWTLIRHLLMDHLQEDGGGGFGSLLNDDSTAVTDTGTAGGHIHGDITQPQFYSSRFLSAVNSFLDGVDDVASEMPVLLVLVAALGLVLWRRRVLRMRVGGGGGGAGGGEGQGGMLLEGRNNGGEGREGVVAAVDDNNEAPIRQQQQQQQQQ